MWIFLVRHILRYRLMNLIIIALLTGIIGYFAFKVQVSYDAASLLPAHDSASIIYSDFKDRFGKDGSVMFIGIQDKNIFDLDKFGKLYDLTSEIKAIDGVEEVVSLGRIFNLVRNDSIKKFDFKPVSQSRPTTQQECDSIRSVIYSLKMYDGLLYNKETNVSLMMITLEESKLKTKERINLIQDIKAKVEQFSQQTGIGVHYSGLPYIRIITAKKLEDELLFFVVLAMLITSVILLIFFRSLKAVFFPMLIVMISVLWVLGTMSILGYKITLLTSVFPPLLIVIVVENCIFLLNKYYDEYRSHGNKVKSLSRVVQRIGNANLLTNATTAAGFAAFIVTGNKLLVEFGVIASINILVAYVLTLFLIPIFFSYLPPPKKRHTKHLDQSNVSRLIGKVVNVVLTRRNPIYIILAVLLIISVFGITKLETTGKIVDDIPKKDVMYKDLMFIEKNFNGVMPFEISIDTKKKKGVQKLSTIKKIEQLEQVLSTYPELSKSISIAEVLKFSKQAFYRGNESMYSLPNDQEKNFILRYIPGQEGNKRTVF